MAKNLTLDDDLTIQNDFVDHDKEVPSEISSQKTQLLITNIIFISYFYLVGVYGLWLLIFQAKWSSLMFTFIFYMMTLLGVTAGAHRLFSHRSYKATTPLQVILMIFHCCAYQRSLVTWVREHRLHHKYTDTNADPHNARRGFFFSHVGWLLVEKHSDVKKKGNLVYMEDVYSNAVVMFQKRHAHWILPLFSFIIPSFVPWFFGETFWIAWYINIFRIMVTMNLSFLSNSLNHIWGYRPYDKSISACQNQFFLYITLGEGFHNFHHVFPWDYRTGELSGNMINFITQFIDFCAKFGMAYDMRSVSEDMVLERILKTGDGTDLWGRSDSGL